jgi:ketosteroid isomerase-like protein
VQRPIQTFLTALILGIAIVLPTMAADNETHPAAQAVLNFNKAVTTRDMETGLALLADGAVQYHLHPAHPGMSEEHPLTEDMTAMWTTVSALLFSTTEAYERHIEIRDVRVDGELAVVWTQTRTVTRREGKEQTGLEFSEMYFLINKDNGGWRIAGTATNRPVDDISIG